MKAIIMVLALAFSFMPGSKKVSSNSGTKFHYTTYYWFDLTGIYLRSNTILEESALTGYTSTTDNPKTLREKGFNPSKCSGWPPVPEDFEDPDILFYSHP